jgi:hypothetical protein
VLVCEVDLGALFDSAWGLDQEVDLNHYPALLDLNHMKNDTQQPG